MQYMIPPIHTSTTSLTNKLLIDILTFTISSIKSMTIPPTRNITPGNITFFKDGSFKVKVSPEELKKFLSNDFSGFVVK